MAFGRRMAAFNRLATNRVLGEVAPRLPGFGVIVHVGRRSGRRYRTPVNVFRTPTGYLRDERGAGLPPPVRAVLRLAGVSEFLTLERELVPRAPVADERMSA